MLHPASCVKLSQYAVRKARAGLLSLNDRQVPGTPSSYGDPAMERLLRQVRETMEEATRLRLYPTYSYFRVYKRGDILHRHRDRQACEISVSINLSLNSSRPWPLWLRGHERTVAVSLSPGDGVGYLGIECPHWRNTFRGHSAVQVFLHYVDKNGPNACWKFDRRPRLRVSPRYRRRTRQQRDRS